MKKFEFLDITTADICFVAYGKDLNEIFSKTRETVVMECELPYDKNIHTQTVIELSEFKQRSQKGRGMLQRLSPAIYDKFAAEYDFINKKIIESARPHRAILIYSK